MSWPKAFVRYNGKVRTATVWGCNRRAQKRQGDEIIKIPELAIEIYCPDGPTEFPDPRYKSMIISMTEVLSVNWECANLLEKYGIECTDAMCTGYGADQKEESLIKEHIENPLFPCPKCGEPYSIHNPKDWEIFPALCKGCRIKKE